jgi:rhamnose transport system permease protein
MTSGRQEGAELAGLPGKPLQSRLWRRRWEGVLLLLLLLTCTGNSLLSPDFLDPDNITDATFNFAEKAIVALPMALLILVREIDISVASIIALAALVIGLLAQAGFGVPVLVLAGLLTGLAAGMVNGALVTLFELPSIVVTIGTMSLFRGIPAVVLGDRALTTYPDTYWELGQGYVTRFVPVPTLTFAVLAALFALLLHWSVIGRKLYAVGNNPVAARFSGIPVNRIRFALFALTGALSGLAAVFLTSRIGSARPDIAKGWELDIITMVVLGGVSIAGGSGTIGGVVLSVLLLGMATFGMGLMNLPGIVMSILVGALLLIAVTLPQLLARLLPRR